MTEADKSAAGCSSKAAPALNSKRRILVGLALILISTSAILANSTFRTLKSAAGYETWSKAQAAVVECLDQRGGVFPTGTATDFQMVTCQFSTAGRIVRKTFRNPGWKYHKGNQIEMRFDPFNPSNCMVSPSVTAQDTVWTAIGFALCFISGCALFIYALKQARAALPG